MSVFKQLDKDDLHHAYLIEGGREEILAELLEFLEDKGISRPNSPDFIHISVDTFKMEDARNLKVYEQEKSFQDGKKVFVITANSILLEAQNALLKVFEEPIADTHFFIVVPDTNSLIRTLVSRFFVLRQPKITDANDQAAEKFLAMSGARRIEFLKELLAEPEEEEEIAFSDGMRTKALRFLNALELALHKKSPVQGLPVRCAEHFFQVRAILRMPGSSVKNLMESVALIAPVIQ